MSLSQYPTPSRQSHDGYVCKEPWEYLEVIANGDVYLCCNGRQKRSIGNIKTSTLKALWMSEAAWKVREAVAKHTFEACGPCIYLDKHKGRVYQQTVADELVDALKVPSAPKRLWLLLDRGCQLACGSCRSEAQHMLDGGARERAEGLRDLVLYDPLLPDVETLWLDGSGEALVSPTHLRTIYHADKYLKSHTNLGILTNGLAWRSVWRKLAEGARDKIRHVSVSVDAASQEVYALNRPPGKWDALLQNLQDIAALKQSGHLFSFKLIMTVQENNWREMRDFALMAEQLGAQPWFTALTNWGTWTGAEYKARAVHLPGHPAHAEFVQSLSQPEFKKRGVLQWVFV